MDLSEAFDVINHGLLIVKLEIYIFLDIPLKTDSKSETIFDKRKPLKMMNNAFYFTLKALFVLKIFKFMVMLKKRLD